ncbi:SPOR domain-containing protein [Flagellimonas abyssi]|uniref:SPOR domain-containing protein n=1 Tax=Flagellimonas abyssi TaxID=2864871 RepID=A0ABS7ENK8_9FLAO|nr:SPOR domain-containing protein [Allomuricauda abyssi]MBW8199015.1 SPOR domain-containing protein [Allomuricauda abyssi]
MRIDSYIEKLLFDYNCVVVPGFGAFLAHGKSAEIDLATNTLVPPSKTISFNAQLSKNDGLLVSHISKEKNLGYEDMLQEVENIAKDWNSKLAQGESIELFGIGKLWHNSEQRIQFQPEEKINFLTSSFGLSTFAATPIQREVIKEEVEEMEERIPFIITPEKREQTSFRPWLKYAAVFLLAVSLGVTSYSTYGDLQQKEVAAQQDAQQEVSRLIQEATFFESAPLELPAININVTKKRLGKHHVIAGAFREEQNADKKVAQLKDKGYNAFYLGVNKYGLHQVAYDSFDEPKEALAFLRKVKAEDSRDAWLLSEK